jgi:hypothetical protein
LVGGFELAANLASRFGLKPRSPDLQRYKTSPIKRGYAEKVSFSAKVAMSSTFCEIENVELEILLASPEPSPPD